jgi:glutaconate CoA-transferase subunit A
VREDTATIQCPFTGEQILLIPALNPNVAIVHVHRCDAYGNAQIDGLQFMDVDLAMAADRVILTTERIVSNEQIRRTPDQTKIAFFCVDAVVEVPFGSAPHECYGLYEPMMKHLNAFTSAVNADPVGGMKEYLDRYVYAPKDWNAYLELIGMDEVRDVTRRARELHDD